MPTEYAKKRILQQLIGLPRKTILSNHQNAAFCAVVVDDDTLRIVSSAVKYYDLLENGVSVIQSIMKTRQPLPELDCIYFLSPRKDVIEKLIQDFKNERKPCYKSAHIFWSTSVMSDPKAAEVLLQLVGSASGLIPRLKSFVDFNMHFRAYESRVFHLDMPHALLQLFDLRRNNVGQTNYVLPNDDLLRDIAARLATVCVSMGDLSAIRFYSLNKHASLNRQISKYVYDYFERIKPEETPTRNQTELIIIDRSFDPCVLLLHEYTYQALAYDVLEIPVCAYSNMSYQYNAKMGSGSHGNLITAEDEDTYKYMDEKKQMRSVVLDEHDELWMKYRHKHIASVITSVNDELKKFSKDNAAAKYVNAKNGEVDIAGAIRALPQYTEMLNKFMTHITLSESCFSTLSKTGIFRAGVLEQDLATGVDKFGKSIQVLKILEELAKLVSDKSGILMTEKVRLLLLYFTMMSGVQTEDKKKMIRAAGMSIEIEQIIEAFGNIDIIPQATTGAEGGGNSNALKHVHRIHRDEEKLHFYKRKAKSAQYELSRFEPSLKEVMELAVAKRLPRSKFPYLADPDFDNKAQYGGGGDTVANGGGRIRAAQFDWDWTTHEEDAAGGHGDDLSAMVNNASRKKIIIFVLGGISFSEIRSAYEVTRSSTADVFIGGTSIVTTPMLFNMLKAQCA